MVSSGEVWGAPIFLSVIHSFHKGVRASVLIRNAVADSFDSSGVYYSSCPLQLVFLHCL